VATPVNQQPVFQSPFNKQRRDKFLCVLTIPTILKDKVAEVARRNSSVNFNTLQFSVFGAIAPPVEIPPVLVPYGGQTLKVTSYARPEFPSLKINFTVDNQFNNYWVLFKWLDIFNNSSTGIFDPSNQNIDSNTSEYMTDISIYGLDEYNKQTVRFDYIRTFPIGLEGVNYNDRDSSEMECGFQFAYHQLKMSLL
jgi:hypothetical protein